MSMNMSLPRLKISRLDLEVNWLSKIMFTIMIVIALMIVAVKGFRGSWEIDFFRQVLLLCSIIPISVKINLDLAKLYHSRCIKNDKSGYEVNNSSIPEDLGRLQYLLSDKTGTLTKNEMIFKKIGMQFVSYNEKNMDQLTVELEKAY